MVLPAFSAVPSQATDVIPAQAQEDFVTARRLVENRQAAEGQLLIEKKLAAASDEDTKQRWMFMKAWALTQIESFDEAQKIIDELDTKNFILGEELHLLRAQILEKKKATKEAMAEYQKILTQQPNFHNRFQVTIRLARLNIETGKTLQARQLLTQLEKRSRGTPEHVDVVWELARTEFIQAKYKPSPKACKWIKVLYKKYAAYPGIQEWTSDMTANILEGKATGCQTSRDDFRGRIRSLIWAGQEAKAKGEIAMVASNLAKVDEIASKELMAWFALSTGEVERAYLLLDELYPKRKESVGFLELYASASARNGNSASSIGALYRIYQLSNKSTPFARKALYQSAFQSYQFADYDGASQKFSEFIKKYPKSGLTNDAHWNLAWISYLKGNYRSAIDQLGLMNVKRRGKSSIDRVQYWQAMSYLRLEDYGRAKKIFRQIVASNPSSYYASAAANRLEKWPVKTPAPVKAEDAPSETPRLMGPPKFAEFLAPTYETSMMVSPDDQENESEETLLAEEANEGMAAESEETSLAANDEDAGPAESDKEDFAQAPANHQKRFQRAKVLKIIGFRDESKWELYEIEKKVRDRDELKILLQAYEDANQFHRSSTIAQNRFTLRKIERGPNSNRKIWETAYPLAYDKFVKAAAQQNDLPNELIFGIMRAESRFRRDAISPVGALGLMQIMPATGNKLATLRKKNDFAPMQLLEPEQAVDYGAYYLKRLNTAFGGSIPLTAAAYNAGPHRVHSWLLSFGDIDMDEFIEHIPYLETREYVRRVVSNFITYGQLYFAGKNKIDLSMKLNIKGSPEQSLKEVWD